MTKRRPTIERRDRAANPRAIKERQIRLDAEKVASVQLGAFLAGCSGQALHARIEAGLAYLADQSARHIGAAETCSGLGANAHRVGGRILVPDGHQAAERVFKGFGR